MKILSTLSIILGLGLLLYSTSIIGQCVSPKITQIDKRTICENDDVSLLAENCVATVYWYSEDPEKNKNTKPFDFGKRVLIPKVSKTTTIFARCEQSGCASTFTPYTISVTKKSSNSNANFSYGLKSVCTSEAVITPVVANKNTQIGSFICLDSVGIALAKDGSIYPQKSKAGNYFITNVVKLNSCETITSTARIQIKECAETDKCPSAIFGLSKKVFQTTDSTTYRPSLNLLARAGTWSITGKYNLDNDGGFTPSLMAAGTYIITNTLNLKQCKKEVYSDTIKIVENSIKGNSIIQKEQLYSINSTTSSSNDYSINITPPSPNAASLGKYGDISVSYYTGKPSTEIPIYTINSGDITVPISMSYSHGGIQVEEEASNIGLGWSLNAGGVITRTVRGLDDLKAKGIPFIPLPATPETNSNFVTNLYDGNLGFPGVDTENDIFYFNVGGSSGKFIVTSTNGAFPLKGISLNGSDVSITCTLVSGVTTPPNPGSKPKYRWEIILENGMKHIFEQQEISSTVSANSSLYPQSFEYNNYSSLPSLDFNRFRNGFQITAWYLSKIESPFTGENITFNYDTLNYYYSTSQLRANEIFFKNGFEPLSDAGTCTTPVTLVPKENTFTYSATISRNAYLKSILFNGGNSSVVFDLSDRLDMLKFDPLEAYPYPMMVADIDDRTYSVTSGKKPQKIDAIRVLSGTNEAFSWKFNYSYFNSNQISNNDSERKASRYLRLRLDGVQQKEIGTTNVLPGHRFYYYGDVVNTAGQVITPVNLPTKTSWAKDYWGYYNGKAGNDYGTHIIPKLAYPKMCAKKRYMAAFSGDYNLYYFDLMGFDNTDALGIDREAVENFMQYGSLRTVVYPTGGNTQFEFEQNRAWGGANEITQSETTASNSSYNSGMFYHYATDTDNTFADITFKLTCGSVYPPSSTNTQPCAPASIFENDANVWYAKIKKGTNSDFIVKKYIDWPNNYAYPSLNPVEVSIKNLLLIKPSTNYESYQILVNPSQVSSTPGKYFPAVNVKMKTYKLNTTDFKEVSVGGLRIKRIISRDSSQVKSTKIFSYLNYDKSTSGKQMRRMNNYIYGYKEMLRIQDLYATSGRENPEDNYPLGWETDCPRKQWGIEINAYSITPLGNSANGSNIGYDRVIVEDEGVSNGKVIYEYVNQPDVEPESKLFADLPSTPHYGNGMLKYEYVYGADNFLRKYITYEPTIKASQSQYFQGMKMLTPGYLYNTTTLYLAKAYYQTKVEFWYNASKTERTSNLDDYAYSISKNYYGSSNHNQLTKTEYTDAKGNTLSKTYIYPMEKSLLDPSSVYTEMVSKNIKDKVIEAKSLNGTAQVSLNITEFQKLNGLFLPKNIKYQLSSNDPVITKLTFDSYSTNGKVLSYTDESGLVNQFTWWDSFNVEKYGLLKSKTINNQTVNYDYYPLVGTKSVTDARGQILQYTYDGFGRLVSTSDSDNNLLSSTSYHYGNSGYYAQNCSINPPSFSVTGSSLCSTTLTATGCTGNILWNNGTVGNTLNLRTNVTTPVSATCLQQNGCISPFYYSVNYPTVPYQWYTQDIGYPTPGCTFYDSGNLTLSGSGTIWSNNDSFHWMYKSLYGDFTFITKISSMPSIDGKRAGLMIRPTLTVDCPFYEIFLDGNGSVGKTRRTTSGGNVELVGVAPATVGQTWLKLEKVNSKLKGYYRLDSQTTWTEFGWDIPITYPLGVFIGLVSNDNTGDLNTTTFSNTTINGIGF